MPRRTQFALPRKVFALTKRRLEVYLDPSTPEGKEASPRTVLSAARTAAILARLDQGERALALQTERIRGGRDETSMVLRALEQIRLEDEAAAREQEGNGEAPVPSDR